MAKPLGNAHNVGRTTAASNIRHRILEHGEGFWRAKDFPSLPPLAVSQTLSRLAHERVIQRVAKGIYFRPRATMFGESQPARSDVLAQRLRMPLKPAGLTAANLLGFTTQNPTVHEYATTASAVSRQALAGEKIKIYTRRPEAWKDLSAEDAALLEFLRDRGRTSELSDKETQVRLLSLLKESGRFQRLVAASASEPPRVRAMLGALGQGLQVDLSFLDTLKASLNPLSRFDFGVLSSLRHAKDWQAK